ncbi:MAG: hypothetical protein LBI42_12170 [Chitinispirillales bacterium]|jgi:ABC-type transport system involved in multi-copper enzyme maturation permease subunit|nr:hypothetical protein [Chitinispirillales bacterium]
MAGILTVLQKELASFTGSDKGVFFVYAIIVTVWSFMLLTGEEGMGGQLWFVFFSVIVAANFSSTVFISERISGNLEVFITSGLSRDAILFGKMIFVIIMTAVVGLSCAVLAAVLGAVLPEIGDGRTFGVYDASLYLSATFLNVASSAYLSVRLSNPRLLHFINIFMLGAVVIAYSLLSALYNLHDIFLLLGFLLLGILFTLLAKREFAGERIIQPVIF